MRLFVDNLINIDFSYLHPVRGLLGETWLASVELQGKLDEQGMVCDFGVVKKRIRDWLNTELDHRLLVPGKAQNLTLKSENGSHEVLWKFGQTQEKHLACTSPEQAITLIEAEEITLESVAQWCQSVLLPQFPESIESFSIQFICEAIDTPFYHYSHGLKKHAGNCQRIAHGHRSKIEIWRNDILSTDDMQEWAKTFEDIYIATKEDLVAEKESHFAFEYQAEQGNFSLEIPKDTCYLIDTDSTVEYIAQHIASKIKTNAPGETITVKAYEGLGKGAIISLK
ncbi:6-carboxytetrahydropterin synthase [Teredinibacter sp. KSP-S5-2]|uniref:6-carboxytetrahydropterin synthase n=1 Tax=Teredinibacter sp. KSP-S5-2 TaxID=3034506 RepID=UPI0029347E76|nr:6-carboxytetrahydropterin synthase [Teredinibacter sp. KSP-S5-2]WNO10112.1 6-carboxytetrahydropterin synthase [Teredinibacter sp. KSP-S5-2]